MPSSSSRTLQCEVRKTGNHFYSTHHPEYKFMSREDAERYDQQLAETAAVVLAPLVKGKRADFHSLMFEAIDKSLPNPVGSNIFEGEEPEDFHGWASLRYSPLDSDLQSLANQSPLVDVAIKYLDENLGSKHRGILVDPTFVPARNHAGFQKFLESEDQLGSIFESWQGYRAKQPTVTFHRALNLPDDPGLSEILGGEGLRSSLVRNALAKRPVSLDALFNQPFGRQVIDRLKQENVENQMLQSVTRDPDIAWLVGSNPTFTGSQNKQTNSVFNLTLEIPEMDLLRLDDFGPFSQNFKEFNYQDSSGIVKKWSDFSQVEQFAYLPIASSQITATKQKPFSEKFPGNHNWVPK